MSPVVHAQMSKPEICQNLNRLFLRTEIVTKIGKTDVSFISRIAYYFYTLILTHPTCFCPPRHQNFWKKRLRPWLDAGNLDPKSESISVDFHGVQIISSTKEDCRKIFLHGQLPGVRKKSWPKKSRKKLAFSCIRFIFTHIILRKGVIFGEVFSEIHSLLCLWWTLKHV